MRKLTTSYIRAKMLEGAFTQEHMGVYLCISVYTSECYQLAEQFCITPSRLTCKKNKNTSKITTKNFALSGRLSHAVQIAIQKSKLKPQSWLMIFTIHVIFFFQIKCCDLCCRNKMRTNAVLRYSDSDKTGFKESRLTNSLITSSSWLQKLRTLHLRHLAICTQSRLKCLSKTATVPSSHWHSSLTFILCRQSLCEPKSFELDWVKETNK